MTDNVLALSSAAMVATQAAAEQFLLAAAASQYAQESAVYNPIGDSADMLVPIQLRRGGGYYAAVYTGSTGCDGTTGSNGRHNLNNLRALDAKKVVAVDYINTNYQSDKNWAGAAIPVDSSGKSIPGNKIAHVARGGNDPTGGSQLGKDLLRHYNLSAFSHDVVLVFVTDPNNRRADRIVSRFDSSDYNFPTRVLDAANRDRVQHQGRTGALRI